MQEVIRRVSGLEDDPKAFYLRALLELAALRGLEELVEGEIGEGANAHRHFGK